MQFQKKKIAMPSDQPDWKYDGFFEVRCSEKKRSKLLAGFFKPGTFFKIQPEDGTL